MLIKEVVDNDFDNIWPLFHQIASDGETYAYAPDISKDDARKLWINFSRKTFIVVDNNEVLGTYYIKTNQAGPGSHVCNCGYMVASKARGKGIATMMCEHSQKVALKLGYKAMQFNFVASSNTGAISLWHKLGFKTVGTLPKAFNHPRLKYIDALVMYKWLD